MSGRKTKEYRWYFRQIVAQMVADGEIDGMPENIPFRRILRIVNEFKKNSPEYFEELRREFAGS